MRLHHDVVVGGVLLVLSLLYYLGTREMPAGRGEPGPAFFPVLLSVALALLALLILAGGWRARARMAETEPKREDRGHPWKAWAAVGLTAAYILAFETLGFALSTWLYTLAMTAVLRRDRPVLLVAVPLVSTAIIYLLFAVGLGVRLSPGILG